jgi:putative acetyltransferase
MDKSNFTIRKIRKSDNKYLGEVIRGSFLDYDATQTGTVFSDSIIDRLFEEYNKPRAIYYVLEINGIVMGGSGIQLLKKGDRETAELQKMYLKKEARGKGYGRALLEKCIEFAKEEDYKRCYLESLPELKDALRMYEHAGFQYIESRLGDTGYYGCSLYMVKSL